MSTVSLCGGGKAKPTGGGDFVQDDRVSINANVVLAAVVSISEAEAGFPSCR